MSLIAKIEQEQQRKHTSFRPGDHVKVHVRIKEGDKERIQIFEGIVLARRNRGAGSAFTVRKLSYGVGVERVFPLHSPAVEKIEVITANKVRRARLFYLRDRVGKKARLKSRDKVELEVVSPLETEPEEPVEDESPELDAKASAEASAPGNEAKKASEAEAPEKDSTPTQE